MLRGAQIRHRVDPGDVPEEKAARRLGVTVERFRDLLPRLKQRQFPDPDPDTGNYDLDAIDLWRKARHPRLYGLTPLPSAGEPAKQSMGERFHEAKERGRHGSSS